jgi:type II secretory pathway pseudopilin PulG
MVIKIKKAAMFGLDARIALAIFGALSVISGAALYSAIQSAKATALYNQLSEIGKAWEQYYLDTGVNLPVGPSSIYVFKSSSLVENTDNISSWKGPYINLEIDSVNDWLLVSNNYRNYNVIIVTDSEIWGEEVEWVDDLCTSGKKCALYVNVDGVGSDLLAKKIDDLFDSGNGGKKGNFKWHSYGGGSQYAYYLKIKSIKNPND